MEAKPKWMKERKMEDVCEMEHACEVAKPTKEDELRDRAVAAEELAWFLWARLAAGCNRDEYAKLVKDVEHDLPTPEGVQCLGKLLDVLGGKV